MKLEISVPEVVNIFPYTSIITELLSHAKDAYDVVEEEALDIWHIL